jgi:hypothetical protein
MTLRTQSKPLFRLSIGTQALGEAAFIFLSLSRKQCDKKSKLSERTEMNHGSAV